MKKLNNLYGQMLKNPIAVEKNQPNFILIGNDCKNPWGIQSSKLSPEDVLAITKLGVEIFATPHIGLARPAHFMYPHMGAIMCDFTGNQSRADYVAEPENIKEGGSRHDCALQPNQILSPYLELNQSTVSGNGFVSAKKFASATNLAYVHHRAKKEAFGKDKVILDVSLFDAPFTFDFLKVLTENQEEILQGYHGRQGIFDRYVSRNGVLERCIPGKVTDIAPFLMMKRVHQEMIIEDMIIPAEGHVPLNEAMILFDSIYCYWKQFSSFIEDKELGDTYSISGVDMINYTKSTSFRTVIDRMYQKLLQSKQFWWLPERMVHTMIPGGVLTFLPSNKEEELCEAVINLLKLDREKETLRQKMSQASEEERASIILDNRNKPQSEFSQIKVEFQKAIARRRGFTQYDILNGEFVPSEIIEGLMPMTFERMTTLFKTS